MHTYISTHTHTHTYISTHTHTNTCPKPVAAADAVRRVHRTLAPILVKSRTSPSYMCTYIYIYICIYIHIYIQTHIYSR